MENDKGIETQKISVNNTKKTKEKKIKFWDVLIKEIFDRIENLEHYSDFKVGKLPLEIDYIIRLTSEQKTQMNIPIFKNYLTEWNIFEFKLIHDRDKPTDLWKLLGYTYLFLEKKEILPQFHPDISAWYVCSEKPKLLTSLESDITRLTDGVYLLSLQFPIYLIVIEELPNVKENIALKLFTTKKQLSEVWDLILQENLSKEFLSVSFLLYPEEMENFLKRRGTSMEDIGINISTAVRKIGLKAVIDEIGLKAVIDEIGLKAVIDEIGLKAVIDEIGLKAVIDEIGWDQLIDKISDLEQLEQLKSKLERKEKKLLQSTQ